MNNISNSDSYSKYEWYKPAKELTDVIFHTPENNTGAVKAAITAIKKGSIYSEKGLTEKTKQALQKLALSLTHLDSEQTKNEICSYLDEKVNELASGVLQTEVSSDVLRHIAGFTSSWKDAAALSTTSKPLKQATEGAVPEKQMASVLKGQKPPSNILESSVLFFKNLTKKRTLPPLSLPADYSFEGKPFADFKNLMPPNFDLEKGLKQLLSHASSIKPGSPEEKLALYLMKHVPWNAEKTSQLSWPKNSAIKLIADDAVRVLEGKEPLGIDELNMQPTGEDSEFIGVENTNKWGVIRYREAYIPNKPSVIQPRPTSLKLLASHYIQLGNPYNANPDFALACLHQNPGMFKLLADDLKNDKKFVIKAVSQNGEILEFLSAEQKKDEDIVLAAVKQKGKAIRFADAKLKENKKIGMAAVGNSGDALYYLSSKLQDDKNIVLVAFNDPEITFVSIKSASKRLLQDREVALKLVNTNGVAWSFLDKKIQFDHEIALAAVKKNPFTFKQQAMHILFSNDDKIVAAIMENNTLMQKDKWELAAFFSDRLKRQYFPYS